MRVKMTSYKSTQLAVVPNRFSLPEVLEARGLPQAPYLKTSEPVVSNIEMCDPDVCKWLIFLSDLIPTYFLLESDFILTQQA